MIAESLEATMDWVRNMHAAEQENIRRRHESDLREAENGWEAVVRETAGAIKQSNPKDSVGVRKSYRSTVPAPFVHGVGQAMLEGGREYGRHNYRSVGVRASVYYDAFNRHMDAWWEGQDDDPKSGLNHILKAAACLAVLYDALIQGKLEDDRPPKSPEGWLEDMNQKAAAIVEKFPNPKPAYTERRK